MTISVDIDMSDFNAYAADLTRAVTAIGEGIPKVVGKGALKVKNEWNAAFAASQAFSGIAGSVSYDTRTTTQFAEAQIGPDKANRPAARLANIAHFGGANGGGGTVDDPQSFLNNEADNFVGALDALIAKALG